MCYGKPAILIPTPNHTEQLSNAKQAASIGVAKVIQQEKFSREKLLEKVKQILDSHMPKKLEQVQKEVMQYDGLEAAANVVFEIVKNK
jgi:UDP:flavonoid glycosyltransferase YjiC (YdhE family)